MAKHSLSMVKAVRLMSFQILPINQADPYILHIDLNSCFATIEAQANRLLRGRPVGVAAYDTPRGFVLAANYVAKSRGVVMGVTVAEARKICPDITIMTPDPPKYREAHKRFKDLLIEYTPMVVPKSIDEFVIDVKDAPIIKRGMTVEQLGYDIKEKVKQSLGEAVTVNVGIAPNRFLAKYAAGFNKPDGLNKIDFNNLHDFYKGQDLVDLPGINVRYKRRLWLNGITTPLEFLEADPNFLMKQVFKSIVGYHWHMRLRGWEADNVQFKRRSIGQQYALATKTDNLLELEKILMKLCEKAGRRLRRGGWLATGVHLYLGFDGSYENYPYKWSRGKKLSYKLYGTLDIYRAMKELLHEAILYGKVRIMAVTLFNLAMPDYEQFGLFDENHEINANKRLSDALDLINSRYGEYVITPATIMNMKNKIIDRIAFGSVNDLMSE